MKSKLMTGCLVLGAAAWLTGCGDDNMSSAPAPTPPKPAAPAAPPAPAAPVAEAPKPAAPEAAKPAETVKTQVEDAAKAAQKLATDAAAAAQQKLTDLVAEVKKLIADGKGADALQKLQSSLGDLKLTPEQQKTIDDLKKQAQEALSKKGVEAATKAVGDFLKPKTQN